MGKQNSKITNNQLTKLIQCTHFDKKELKQWYKKFIIECPTGQVDMEQFINLYQKLFPFGEVKPFAELLFNIYDMNQDGLIDFEEFIRVISISLRGEVDEKLKWAFQLYDLNRDGFITRSEMITTVRAIYLLIANTSNLPTDELTPEQRVDKLFDALDSNQDDQLSFEEFCMASQKMPDIFKALTIYDGLV
ncbi:EF-hand [Neoconidiobolus thromboides FSU 785]|nr:EF-hand [Neoconidiobolus thromboides FSU 785]